MPTELPQGQADKVVAVIGAYAGHRSILSQLSHPNAAHDDQ
jgi:hypothetical protein